MAERPEGPYRDEGSTTRHAWLARAAAKRACSSPYMLCTSSSRNLHGQRLRLRMMWSALHSRLGRHLAVACYAVGIGVYLTLGDLPDEVGAQSNAAVYFAVAAVLLAGLVVLIGWQALWFVPACTLGFAVIYEQWFWTAPPGVGDGMDSIGYRPTSVIAVLVLGVPFVLAAAALRDSILAKRSRRDGPSAPIKAR